MEKRDNYALASAQARQLFLGYDQQKLAAKRGITPDDEYLYTVLFSERYRIHRLTGDVSRLHRGSWVAANSFSEVLTLLDLMCDSREDRHPAGVWKSMAAFGLQFHQNLLEKKHDPWAEQLETEHSRYARAFEALGGEACAGGDMSYTLEIWDGLRLKMQLWFADEDFPAQVLWLWDENALMYLKYETMYYALGLLKERLEEELA